MEPAVISDGEDCRLPLLEGATALSAPARAATGEFVVAALEGDDLRVVAVHPDGTEAWREELGEFDSGDLPVVRLDEFGRVYADRSDGLWYRAPDGISGVLSLPDEDLVIDGSYAVCSRNNTAVALVRGPNGRGPVRLDANPGAWPLDRPLDVKPALPPAISLPDETILIAWSDGTITAHDIDLETASTIWNGTVDTANGITGLAVDDDGSFWITTATGVLLRLAVPHYDPTLEAGFKWSDFDQEEVYHRVDLGTNVHTPPVLESDGTVLIGLDDGSLAQGVAGLSLPIIQKADFPVLNTHAPGTLVLLEGDGLQLLGHCPEGRCLSVFFHDSASFFGEAFDISGEHRYTGLPWEAEACLPGDEGVTALAGGGRLEGLVVAGPTRNTPWPGPDGGAGNGRCMEVEE